jgi:SAM-dependent methyltransferase
VTDADADADAFRRYLRAKRTVDDRAIDRRLVGTLRERLRRSRGGKGRHRVLDVGAGIGTMLARFLEWDVLPEGEIRYTAVDVDPDSVAAIEPYVREWAEGRSASVDGTDPIVVDGPDRRVELEPVAAEAIDYADRATEEFDLLVGAALLDILDLGGLDRLLGALVPGGLCYFPITFDGGTRFRPAHPADREIERRYHAHMDAKPGGSSRAGGDAVDRLRRDSDVRLLGVAGSDWIVRPIGGAYPDDEAYFLRYILDTVESAVGETTDGDEPLEGWLAERRTQLEAGELIYLTHQLDVLGRVR